MTQAPASEQPTDFSIDEVSASGLVGHGERDAVLDVLLDGRPVWSLRFLRDSWPRGTQRVAPWPEALWPYLDGIARVSVREHSSGSVWYDREIRLGAGSSRIAVVDEAGRPLSVNAKGHLAALLSQRGPDVVEALLDAAEDVLERMRDVGIEGFLAYGSLLGAVRSGHMIAHDYDADLSYLSVHEYPVDAILESYRIERAISSGGYATRRYSAMAFQVQLDPADPHHPWLDVFGSLIVSDMLYVLWDVGAPLRRDQVLPLTTCHLEGRELPAPRDVDAWLSATYGRSWRVPDPAFQFTTPPSTRRRLSGWFGRLNRGSRAWHALHAGTDERRMLDEPSDFARWVAGHEPDADVVVDVGCGTGTDALWFARTPFAGPGRTVLGVDYSAVALTKARTRAERAGSAACFRKVNLADLRSVLVTGATLARLPGRRVLAARFVVDGLTEAERSYLWLLAKMASRGNGAMYLEIAVARDPRQPAFAAAHRLRKLRGPVLRAEVEAAGATVSERVAVESPPDADVPDTTRMVLSWPT